MPPPLFQAYPQSVKHVNLEASTLSAESIMRMNEQRSATLIRNRDQNTLAVPADSAMAARRPNRGTTSIANAEWRRKVYVLTTSGHVLQYNGEGTFDRKPEKVLQLGKDSAAFASDAIEGRHFVLQVSQACSDDGEPDLDSSKRIFFRMGIKTASARQVARVLFMVFDSPVEFDSWLSAIRKMIGSLGGRSYSHETLGNESDHAFAPTTHPRYMVRKDPCLFSQKFSPADSAEAAAEERPSTQSSTYTATDLERLRDSKTSNISAGTETATSLLDSPPSSPLQGKSTVPSVPQLELPDLGPSSLVDFSKHGKRNSRFSVLFSDLTRQKSIEVKATTQFSRQISFRSRPSEKEISIPEKKQIEETILVENQEKMQEHRGELLDDQDSQGSHDSQRPLSTISPLPTSFHVRRTVPDLSSARRDSRQSSASSDLSTKLPKRYSSLDYSPSQFQSHSPHSSASKLTPPLNTLRRPTSMQLRREPHSSILMPARTLSLRTFGLERASSAAISEHNGLDSRPSSKQSQGNGDPAFGPPAGPPPSCPLPAVPLDGIPLRRQSLAARKFVLSGSWGGEPPEFF